MFRRSISYAASIMMALFGWNQFSNQTGPFLVELFRPAIYTLLALKLLIASASMGPTLNRSPVMP